MYVVKAATEKVGKLDRKAVAQALHGAEDHRRKEHPGVLHGRDASTTTATSTARASSSRSKNGKQEVKETLPPLAAK